MICEDENLLQGNSIAFPPKKKHHFYSVSLRTIEHAIAEEGDPIVTTFYESARAESVLKLTPQALSIYFLIRWNFIV